MKKKLIALLLLFTVLCACADALPQASVKETVHSDITQITTPPANAPTEAPTEAPPPVDPAPAQSATAVTIDGTPLSACYQAGETLLLPLQELAELWEAELVTTVEDGAYLCQLRADGLDITLCSGSVNARHGGAETTLSCAPVYDGVGWYVPAEILPQWLGYSELNDTEQNHRYYTTLPDPAQVPDGYRVPILMYHAVSDDCWGIAELFVSPSDMEAQLKYLTENGYTPIWFEDLPHIAEYEKPVILTFDDGYDDNYTELFPLLQKYNVKATIFCIGNAFGTSHKMTAEQAKEMSDSGLVSIQSHTMTHPDLDKLGQEALEYEIGQSKTALARVTGKEPFVLCYPTGYCSGQSLEVTAQYYSYGLLMGGGYYTTGGDRYLVYRQYVSRYTDIYSFAAMVS